MKLFVVPFVFAAALVAPSLALGQTAAGSGPEGVRSDLSVAGLAIPATLFAGGQQDPADWQRRYDNARGRRDSGKKKIWLGLALDVAGVATVFVAANDCLNDFYSDCTGNSAAAVVGSLTAATGGVTFLWGLIQYIGANGEVNSLEASRPLGRSPNGPTIPLSDHQGIQLSAGPRTSAAYSLRW